MGPSVSLPRTCYIVRTMTITVAASVQMRLSEPRAKPYTSWQQVLVLTVRVHARQGTSPRIVVFDVLKVDALEFKVVLSPGIRTMNYPCFLEQTTDYIMRASINQSGCSHTQATMPAPEAGIQWSLKLGILLSIEKNTMTVGL